jgi:ABC-type multidrug transport system fused ATPase/permease subunit
VSEDKARPDAPERARLAELWPYVRDHTRVLGAIAVISLVATALALIQPLTLQRVIDDVGSGRTLTPAITVLVAVTLGEAIFSALQSYLLQRTAEGVVLGARRSLVAHLFRLPVAEYDRRRIGDLISRVGADTTLLRAVVTSGLFDIVSSVLMFVGAVALMAYVDVSLLLITLTAVVLGAAAVLGLGSAIRRASQRAQSSVGDMTASVERALGAIRTIRAAGATERETERVGEAAVSAYRAGIDMAKLNALVQPIMSLCIQGAFIVVLGYGGYRVAIGDMTLGDLVAFLLYLFMLVMPLAQAVHAFTTLQAGLGALDRMQEVMQIPAEDADEESLSPTFPLSLATSSAMLELADVSFAYDGGPAVLDHVSFTVDRGSRTAIVGPSGAGKSTALALVERFYDPSAGTVSLDGVDVSTLPRDEVRRRIAYVEQEAPVLAGSIADNLRLAAPDASDDELMEVLDQVGLSELVDRTDRGLDVPVGDDGVLLSGGQRQRLAWARALLAGPELLLLDEPTSSVDSRTEQVLQDALRTASRKRTVLVVAHRLATVADSDRIVVLDNGRITAVGTHGELLASSPLYRELATHQLLVNS